MSTIVVYSSYRSDGNTTELINYISSRTKYTIANLKDHNIESYNYDGNYSSDDFVSLVKEIIRHRNIIFISPVYWYSISGELKLFIDRYSDLLTVNKKLGRKVRGKNVYLISHGFIRKKDKKYPGFLVKTCKYMGMEFVKYEHICFKKDRVFKNKMKHKIDLLVNKIK